MSNEPNDRGPDEPLNILEMKSILVVDDDKQLAHVLQYVLADDNFLVDLAYDGAEALEKVSANDYDAVVCDLKMPRLRGDEFYLRARQMKPALADRFIFITGFVADPNVNKFLLAYEVKYLVKPFAVEGLIQCVRELFQ